MKSITSPFVIAAFLCAAATSCDVHESPTAQQVADKSQYPERSWEDTISLIPDGPELGGAPDMKLLESMMQMPDFERVEREFGAIEWSSARQLNSRNMSSIGIPISPLREQELSLLIASHRGNDLLIFVINFRAKQPIEILEEDDELLVASDMALSFEPTLTLVRAPGLEDWCSISLSDSKLSSVAGVKEKVECIARVLETLHKIRNCSLCGPAIDLCLKTPMSLFGWKCIACLAAVDIVLLHHEKELGDRAEELGRCFSYEFKKRPTQP
jgi:hypothetical protein